MSETIKHERWTDHEIRSQLERILSHPEFRATDRIRDFLRFVVEESLAGNARQLKGFTIATEVFGRDQDFDAAHDPVVRIQAGRLRRAIERYYLVAGANDPIVIDIPKGGYAPVFKAPSRRTSDAPSSDEPPDCIETWPTLLLLPFEVPAERKDLQQIATGLAMELGIELSHCGDLRVMLFSDASARRGLDESTADFLVQVNVRADGIHMKVVVQLVSQGARELLWSDSIKVTLEDGRLIEFQERTAAAIAAHIGGQHGAVYRAVTGVTTGRPKACGGTYAAILKGHAYQQSFDPDAYEVAMVALRAAHEHEAKNGLVSSLLAELYIDNLSLEFFDTSVTPLPEAMGLAHEGVRLAPAHQLCRLVLARAHLLNDDLVEGLNEIERVKRLNPASVLFTDVTGYLQALLGDVEGGARLVREAIALNPFYRPYTRYATWLESLLAGDFELALEEAEWFRGVGSFWAPLARAATLGLLGRAEEGQTAVQRVLSLKPDFVERAPVLVRRYIKFPEAEAVLLEGLERSGLTLDLCGSALAQSSPSEAVGYRSIR